MALLTGGCLVGLLLVSAPVLSSMPAAASVASAFHKDVCTAIHDTDPLDQFDIRTFFGRLLGEGEFDTVSFFLSGSDLALSYGWCGVSLPHVPSFDQTVAKDEQGIATELQDRPKWFNDLLARPHQQPTVALPILNSKPVVENGDVYVHLSWTASNAYQNVWVSLCTANGCSTKPSLYYNHTPGYFQSANVPVPLDEQAVIELQPALYSSPTSGPWAKSVPFFMRTNPGSVTLIIE